MASGQEGSGGVPYFGNRHLSVFFSRTMHPIRIKFGMRHQGNEALSRCAPFLDPPLPKGLEHFTSEIGIFEKS